MKHFPLLGLPPQLRAEFVDLYRPLTTNPADIGQALILSDWCQERDCLLAAETLQQYAEDSDHWLRVPLFDVPDKGLKLILEGILATVCRRHAPRPFQAGDHVRRYIACVPQVSGKAPFLRYIWQTGVLLRVNRLTVRILPQPLTGYQLSTTPVRVSLWVKRVPQQRARRSPRVQIPHTPFEFTFSDGWDLV